MRNQLMSKVFAIDEVQDAQPSGEAFEQNLLNQGGTNNGNPIFT